MLSILLCKNLPRKVIFLSFSTFSTTSFGFQLKKSIWLSSSGAHTDTDSVRAALISISSQTILCRELADMGAADEYFSGFLLNANFKGSPLVVIVGYLKVHASTKSVTVI